MPADPVSLADLWLPVLLASVFVFVASFIAWMVLPHHKADVRKLPGEEAFLAHLKTLGVSPGTYMWPGCENPAEMKSDSYKQRYKNGPWGSMIVVGKQPNFGLNLVLTFVFYIVVSIFVGYLTSLARSAGADYLEVFRVAGAAAVLGYCAGGIPHSIFFGRPLRFVLTELVDAFVYGLITAGTFAWLWPAAAT
ncbi:MAG: hypothetical protein ACYTGC_20345, partial [Planctomycetota bacterium]